MKLCSYQLQTGDRVEFQSEAETLTGIVAATRWSPPGGRLLKAARCIDGARARLYQCTEGLFRRVLGQRRELIVLDFQGRIWEVPARRCHYSPKVTSPTEANAHAALSRANAAVTAARGAIDHARDSLHQPRLKTLLMGLCVIPVLQAGLAADNWYFAVTATDTAGMESLFSNEVRLKRPAMGGSATFAWDPAPRANIAGYTLYYGTAPLSYTHARLVGTNLTTTITIGPKPLTNLVLTVCTAGSNIIAATQPDGPWTGLNQTRLEITNPAGSLYFGDHGGADVSILRRLQ